MLRMLCNVSGMGIELCYKSIMQMFFDVVDLGSGNLILIYVGHVPLPSGPKNIFFLPVPRLARNMHLWNRDEPRKAKLLRHPPRPPREIYPYRDSIDMLVLANNHGLCE